MRINLNLAINHHEERRRQQRVQPIKPDSLIYKRFGVPLYTFALIGLLMYIARYRIEFTLRCIYLVLLRKYLGEYR
jgi:hypothetical protein